MEMLIWGENPDLSKEQTAKNIYALFVDNMESLRSCMLSTEFRSSVEVATKLRSEIKKARVIFSRRMIDELMDVSEEFGVYKDDVVRKPEYKDLLVGGSSKYKSYCDIVLPQKYNRIESILKDYIEFPK